MNNKYYLNAVKCCGKTSKLTAMNVNKNVLCQEPSLPSVREKTSESHKIYHTAEWLLLRFRITRIIPIVILTNIYNANNIAKGNIHTSS